MRSLDHVINIPGDLAQNEQEHAEPSSASLFTSSDRSVGKETHKNEERKVASFFRTIRSSSVRFVGKETEPSSASLFTRIRSSLGPVPDRTRKEAEKNDEEPSSASLFTRIRSSLGSVPDKTRKEAEKNDEEPTCLGSSSGFVDRRTSSIHAEKNAPSSSGHAVLSRSTSVPADINSSLSFVADKRRLFEAMIENNMTRCYKEASQPTNESASESHLNRVHLDQVADPPNESASHLNRALQVADPNVEKILLLILEELKDGKTMLTKPKDPTAAGSSMKGQYSMVPADLNRTHQVADPTNASASHLSSALQVADKNAEKILLMILDEMKEAKKMGLTKATQPASSWWEPTAALSSIKGQYSMVSVMLNSILFTAGINPPHPPNTLPLKKVYQVSVWVGALFSVISLVALVVVNALSSRMQSRTLKFIGFLMGVALLALIVIFAEATLLVSPDKLAYSVCGLIGVILFVAFLYFVCAPFRRLLGRCGISLTGTDDKNAYSTKTGSQIVRG